MNNKLGIRREDKNQWERRVPLTPKHIKELNENHGIKTIIQPSDIRVFKNDEFEKNSAIVQEDLSDCPVIIAVKEIPLNFIEKNKTYVFFSHTIKGQKYNMPLLKKLMDSGCNLIDYEKIMDQKGRRLVFFGRFAGIAGMIDSLWAFGQRMNWLGVKTSLNKIKQTIHYKDLDHAKSHIAEIGKIIEKEGLPEIITPMVVGFAGYGNVSKGAQEILDLLPVKEIKPNQLEAIHDNYSNNCIYKVVFKEKDMVEPISTEMEFGLKEYYTKPHLYRGIFQNYIRRLTILMNCIYWDEKYPRLITKEFLEENYTGQLKLQVIGDISVDINGAIEFTEKSTSPDNPIFVYNPVRDDIIEGSAGGGVVVMAVDNLPCEVPKESSQEFSNALLPLIPAIVKEDYSKSFNSLSLPPEIKNALILHKGKLTPDYLYINKYL